MDKSINKDLYNGLKILARIIARIEIKNFQDILREKMFFAK